MNRKKHFSKAQEIELINYVKKYGIYKTCEKYGISYPLVRRVLNDNGVSIEVHSKNCNLCMYCKRSARFIEFPCSWAHKFIPVKGWKATEVSYKDGLDIIHTYSITDCPLYVPDD